MQSGEENSFSPNTHWGPKPSDAADRDPLLSPQHRTI